MSYRLKFIYSTSFKASSLQNLVNNHKIKCKNEHNNKKYKKT